MRKRDMSMLIEKLETCPQIIRKTMLEAGIELHQKDNEISRLKLELKKQKNLTKNINLNMQKLDKIILDFVAMNNLGESFENFLLINVND